ncbi:type I-C CRISPR-associated endonuclease Cas1c [Dethiosulfatarculus sandiegensis]|uniref:CRISPR-associated endonuclease Cas1 n=1 Tax=Dethiosulfatarculus sandiegensis TaxID=1429043 RepID=A0A0D2J638_9BACT|nr:type I-C CRISPR-associated endonuclease Cas1c [Dethiosulfatarculus sandiegensis]KIX11176.1 CRISPR-associated protein Cas1 [Dethiosulfatarculus sandiegensis]
MKRFLNTLFVGKQGSYLAKEGECVLVKAEGKVALRTPVHLLGGIICFGDVKVSPWLMAHCAEKQTAISFLSENGRFLAKVQGPVTGNVLLRKEQYRRSDDLERSAGIARAFVAAKIANCRSTLLRSLRDQQDQNKKETLNQAARELAKLLAELGEKDDLDTIRGLEGTAAKTYFRAFEARMTSGSHGFCFTKRSRRPPTDEVNALLSFIYTLLVHDVGAACECTGLDSQVGFLHRDRPGRPSLSLDLMEELRPVIADRLVLTLINRRQISKKGFHHSETGAFTMDDATRKTVLKAYQERKKVEVMHPYLKEKLNLGQLPFIQALLLARHLRGDIDGYPAYFHR